MKILEKQHQAKPQSPQHDLFAMPEIIEKVIEIEKPSAALELLEDLDVDNLSPREALQQLYALKDLMKQPS